MTHSVELKRDDGKKVRIEVGLYADRYRGDLEYTVDVTYCLPKKRTWNDVYSTDDYSYRKYDFSGRKDFIYKKQLEHVTEDEIHAVKLELWNKIKPNAS